MIPVDPKGEYLENFRCLDECQKLNTSTKAVYVTKLSDAIIIQLNIFKHIDSISKKFIPNLSIDEEISLWGNRVVIPGVICHEGEQPHCGYYTSGVNLNNIWFLISDTREMRDNLKEEKQILKKRIIKEKQSVIALTMIKKNS